MTQAMTQRSQVGQVIFTSDPYFVVRTPNYFNDDFSDSGLNRPIDIGDGRTRWGFLDVNAAKMAAAEYPPDYNGRYPIVVRRVETDTLV